MVLRSFSGTPSLSKANRKFIFMDFACPMWRYPFGSGGNLVRTIDPLIFVCSRRSSGELMAHSSSRAESALSFIVLEGGGAGASIVVVMMCVCLCYSDQTPVK